MADPQPKQKFQQMLNETLKHRDDCARARDKAQNEIDKATARIETIRQLAQICGFILIIWFDPPVGTLCVVLPLRREMRQ